MEASERASVSLDLRRLTGRQVLARSRLPFCVAGETKKKKKKLCKKRRKGASSFSLIDAFVEERERERERGDIGNHLSEPANATTTATEPKPKRRRRGAADAQIANFRERISKSCSGAPDGSRPRHARSGWGTEKRSRWRRFRESKVNDIVL